MQNKRIPNKVLTELKNRMGADSFKGIARTFLLKVVTFRLIVEELERRRAADKVIRDFLTLCKTENPDWGDIYPVIAALEPEVDDA